MEDEYNSALCNETFDQLLRGGAFGSPQDWPRAMQGIDVDFRFESPLHDLIDQQKSNTWSQAQGTLGETIALDPTAIFVVDAKKALRDSLEGIGVPAAWMHSEDEVEKMVEINAEQEAEAEQLEQMKTASEIQSNAAVQ